MAAHPGGGRQALRRVHGGADSVVAKARTSFEADDFRWAAEVLSHAVFAQPDHAAARELLADTYEQLGYGAENGTWRNFYLSGATELRDGQFGSPTVSASADVIAHFTPTMLFDAIVIQIDGPKAWDENLSIDVVLTDEAERYRLRLANGALTYSAARQKGDADVTLTTTTGALPAPALGGLTPAGLADAGIQVNGDARVLARLAVVLDPGDQDFAIVTL